MENPFEMIMEKLNSIETLLKQKQTHSHAEQANESDAVEILNLNKAATYLSVSKQTMYHYTSTRLIPHFKTQKRIYFKKTELDQWITKSRVKTREEIEQEADNYLMKNKRKW
jgi:excisionase family DNA binding protein